MTGTVSPQRVPFADVRLPLKPLSARERKHLRNSEERYAEHVMRTDAATRRWAAFWRELGEPMASLPPTADPETYAMCRACVWSSEAADAALQLIGTSYGGSVLWRVERSAFGSPDAPQWDTRTLCGRRQVALALFMLRQSRLKYTGKRDRYGRPYNSRAFGVSAVVTCRRCLRILKRASRCLASGSRIATIRAPACLRKRSRAVCLCGKAAFRPMLRMQTKLGRAVTRSIVTGFAGT